MAAVVRDRGGPQVDALYNLMQSYENKLGGGEGIEGLYGSLTQASMQKVLDCMKHTSNLDSRSVFVDIGAGLGRPMLHAMVTAGVSSAWGVELDHVKCEKATAFCGHVMDHLVSQEVFDSSVPVPPVICSPIEKMSTLDPASHAYSFWEGVPPSGKKAFGELFAASKTLRAVAVVQRAMRGQEPTAVMRELGFGPLMFISSFPVKMSGSGRSFTAYVFTKMAPAAATFMTNAALATGAAACTAAALPAAKRGSSKGKGQQVEAGSPAKARKPDGEAGPASPAKMASVSNTTRRKGETAEDGGKGEVEAAVVPRGRGRPPKGAAKGETQHQHQHQVLITSLAEFSRRTKQGLAGTGKAPGGKGAGSGKGGDGPQAAPPTRSSSRLAAKALAAAAATDASLGGAPLVEGH